MSESLAARYRADQTRRDNVPCSKCGGDRLRPTFTKNPCHTITPTKEAK